MPHDTEDMIQLLLARIKNRNRPLWISGSYYIKELQQLFMNLNETIDELKRKIFGTSSEKTRRPDQSEGIQG